MSDALRRAAQRKTDRIRGSTHEADAGAECAALAARECQEGRGIHVVDHEVGILAAGYIYRREPHGPIPPEQPQRFLDAQVKA